MSNLQQKITTFTEDHISPSNGRFIVTLCVKGAKIKEHYWDGVVAGCGAYLRSEGFSQAFYLGGKSRYHPPLRAKIINHAVKVAKEQGATRLLAKDSGLLDTMPHVINARQRNGRIKKGKAMKGFAELDQLQTYIDGGFLTLERPGRFDKKNTPDRDIAAQIVETGLEEPQVRNILEFVTEKNASGVFMGEEALCPSDDGL